MLSLLVPMLIGWLGFFAFFLAQIHYDRELKLSGDVGLSRMAKAINISTTLALVAAPCALGYIFYKSTWYWTLAIAVVGSSVGALYFGYRTSDGDPSKLAKAGFALWPFSLALMIFVTWDK